MDSHDSTTLTMALHVKMYVKIVKRLRASQQYMNSIYDEILIQSSDGGFTLLQLSSKKTSSV